MDKIIFIDSKNLPKFHQKISTGNYTITYMDINNINPNIISFKDKSIFYKSKKADAVNYLVITCPYNDECIKHILRTIYNKRPTDNWDLDIYDCMYVYVCHQPNDFLEKIDVKVFMKDE